MKSFLRRLTLLVCAVLLLCGAFFGILFVVLFGSTLKDTVLERFSRQRFDSPTWKSHLTDDDSDPVKLRMVDDLLTHYKLVGMDQIQINELLGVPPKSNYFRNYDYVYWLGPERGWMSIDSEWLILKFDNAGKVTVAEIAHD